MQYCNRQSTSIEGRTGFRFSGLRLLKIIFGGYMEFHSADRGYRVCRG